MQDMVLELARRWRWLAFHPYDSRQSEPGFPDLTLARPGRLVFAELKSQRGRMSKAQLDWQAALEAGPAAWYLWRPLDWLDGSIQAVLRPH